MPDQINKELIDKKFFSSIENKCFLYNNYTHYNFIPLDKQHIKTDLIIKNGHIKGFNMTTEYSKIIAPPITHRPFSKDEKDIITINFSNSQLICLISFCTVNPIHEKDRFVIADKLILEDNFDYYNKKFAFFKDKNKMLYIENTSLCKLDSNKLFSKQFIRMSGYDVGLNKNFIIYENLDYLNNLEKL